MFARQPYVTLRLMLRIDHVIIAVSDAESWANHLYDRAGLAAVPGGRHDGTGTGNWIVPLGDGYVELMTVVDEAEAEASPLGQWVLNQTRRGDRLAALCLRTDDIDEVAARIGGEPAAMSRRTEDGTVLQWRLAGLNEALSDDALPFFIQWDIDDGEHPGRTSVDHRVQPDDIRWIEYGGDGEALAERLGDHALPIRVVKESAGPRRVAIATAEGMVHVTSTGIV